MPIHSFEPGGVERVALRLASRWQSSGCRVSVVLGRDRGLCRGAAPALDYRTIREPLPTEAWETLWMIWCLFRYLLRETPDVIFCPGNTYTVVCAAMRLLFRARCPPVLVKISNDVDRGDLRGPARFAYRTWLRLQGILLDRFVALAEPMLPQLLSGLRIDPGRAAVIPDPALSEQDLRRLTRRRTDHGTSAACRFLAVGRLCAQKNYPLMIDAFARHSWPDDRLVIAGEGPARRDIEARIADCGVKDRVTLAGHVADVAPLFLDADVVVLSSHYEGVPAVVVEALAAGVPVAATRCCASMDWLLRNGSFGVIAQPGNADALGAAMNLARHLPPAPAKMLEFASRFTLERAAERYAAGMRDLVVAHQARRCGGLRRRVRERFGRGV